MSEAVPAPILDDLIINMQAMQLAALRLQAVFLEGKIAALIEERDFYQRAFKHLSAAHQRTLTTAR